MKQNGQPNTPTLENGVSKAAQPFSNVENSTKPTYALDHLATFKVRNESEIKHPKEKIKVLMELDKSGGIWPQKMYMCFSGQWLLMLDSDMKEIENFPGSLITEPTAFISEDPLEAFNNILIFTVKGVSLNNTEMHAFNVSDVSAVTLVEDLKQLSRGQIVNMDRNKTPIKHVKPDSNHVHDQYGIAAAAAEVASEKQQHDRQQTERDILVLNHCFEDIERFVARLQYAFEAQRELEARQTDHNPHGEGLLMLRSRPPTISEFTDILAKHKLAFNYVQKLHSHFSDATEPLHNMFVSLQAIVNVCQDVYPKSNIPPHVVNPLLRKDTVDFLRGSLNVKEIDLWQSLGPNWTCAKEQFKEPKGSYHPIFYNDWSPDWIVDEDVPFLPTILKKNNQIASPKLNSSKNDTWLNRLKSRNVKIAEVLYSKIANNDKELNVAKGEYLEVIDDTRNWWKVRNFAGSIGYVPHTIMVAQNFDEQSQYSGKDTDSLNSSIIEQEPSRLRLSIYTPPIEKGVQPNVSRSYSMPAVPEPPPMPPVAQSQPVTPIDTMQLDMTPNGPRASMRPRTNDTDMEAFALQSTINEELKNTLQQREKRRDLEILITPQIYINKNSSPREVRDWLSGKGFSEAIVRKLSGLNGQELFALSPHVIESYFGQKESRRLISQIVLQKNISDFKTVRSSELSAKLAKARQKADFSNNGVEETL